MKSNGLRPEWLKTLSFIRIRKFPNASHQFWATTSTTANHDTATTTIHKSIEGKRTDNNNNKHIMHQKIPMWINHAYHLNLKYIWIGIKSSDELFYSWNRTIFCIDIEFNKRSHSCTEITKEEGKTHVSWTVLTLRLRDDVNVKIKLIIFFFLPHNFRDDLYN